MEKAGGVHGDLRSCNVFINEEGTAKFADSNVFGKINNSYTKTLLKTAKCPLPPEQLESLKSSNCSQYSLDESTESWAIGVLLLTMSTLTSEAMIYNWRTYDIDHRGRLELFGDLKSRYSPLLVEVTTKCLSDNPLERPSFTQIVDYISRRKYQG